jgi:single-strand DNA-binding protein
MAKDLNQCNFIGRLGADPDVKFNQAGTAIANFRIAVNGNYKSNGELVKKTTWVPIVCFGRLAEICGKYLEKGKQVFISGEFSVRSWDDQDGNKRYMTEINARDVQFLGGSRGGASNNPASGGSGFYEPPPPTGDDDIPF